jgi:hypothetical protein
MFLYAGLIPSENIIVAFLYNWNQVQTLSLLLPKKTTINGNTPNFNMPNIQLSESPFTASIQNKSTIGIRKNLESDGSIVAIFLRNQPKIQPNTKKAGTIP